MKHKDSGPSPKPLVSVITVVLNGVDHIERTITSVINQTYKNIEYIVIDGGSSDGTQAAIKKHENQLSFWMSESDHGIYDAMNKGINVATGDWLFFLGSDDALFAEATIEEVAHSLKNDLSLVFGNIVYQDQRVIKSRLNVFTLLHNTVHHQSAFYNRDLFRTWRYDASFKLISDFELNLKIYLHKMGYHYIDKIICTCDHRGQSRANQALAYQETNLIRNKYVSGMAGSILTLLYSAKFALRKG
jgi:glycosyltransferase involved in cell wall biosynthesis